MPDRSKVKWSQLKVGMLGLSSFLILGVLIFLLTSTRGVFQDYVLLRTYMDDASGITDGTEVRLNGISHVGYLDRLQLTGSSDRNRAVEFDMKVRTRFLKDIPVDSVAGIAAANLLGDKYINISRGSSPQTAHEGAVLLSLQSQDIPEMLAAFSKLMSSFQIAINRVDNLLQGVEAGKGNIGLLLKDDELYNRLNDLASEGQALMSDVRKGHGTISKLLYDDSLYQQVSVSLKRVDAILADLQAGQGTAGKLLKDPALFDEAQKTIAEIHSLVADVNAGKGTVGKLMKDDELHRRLDDLLAKLNATIDKIDAGQGTIGQLIVNPALYNSLTGATNEIQSLAADVHANPKKFLTLHLKIF
jgi:phospholipid/cholesterol/gamma-HCH transport system substrate-binding protein